MKKQIGFVLLVLLGFQAEVLALTANFNLAEVLFLDSDNYLNKIDAQGNITNVLTPNQPVRGIQHSAVSNIIFIAFNNAQTLGNESYLLVKANVTNNALVGIDSSISDLYFDPDSKQIANPPIQTDNAGNVYYTMYGGQGMKLRRYVDENNITDLINQNIYLDHWLVMRC